MVDKFIPKLDLSLPGHNYLGPGNPIDNGHPVDSDDEIAKKHDHDYENADTSEDVRAADREAIGDFTGNLIKTGHWHNAVGASGLAAKYVAESVTGVIYPRIGDKDGKNGKTESTNSNDSSGSNTTDKGKTVDRSDDIAKKRAEKYENAASCHDIRSADREAIGDLTGNFIKTGNLHNAVGATGLAVKYAVDRVTGVVCAKSGDKK